VTPTNRRTFYVSGALLAIAALCYATYLAWPTPQLGPDENVKGEVDALFTAVTARDEKLLTACAARIEILKSEKKLDSSAARRLESIIKQARDGGWESAAKQLYTFIQAQRI